MDNDTARAIAEFWWVNDGTAGGRCVTASDGTSSFDIIEVQLTIGAESGVERVDVRSRYPIVTPVTTRLLRSLPLGAMEREARSRVTTKGPPAHAAVFAGWDMSRPGRAGRADVDYARVSARYVELLSGPTPTEALADEMCLSASQVRNVLYEARRRDLLTKSPRGKAGGALTAKALALLEKGNGK